MDVGAYRLSTLHERAYALCLPVKPATIRDSMFRAELFADDILAHKDFRKSDRVLIVGMGAVGIVVAAKLLHRGINVVVCDVRPSAPSWMNSETRSICPTTFDFPVEHWSNGKFPPDASFSPDFTWTAGIGQDVWDSLEKQFNALVAKSGVRGFGRITGTLVDLADAGDKIKVSIESLSKGREDSELFDGVILCTGPGREKLALRNSQFSSRSFWWVDDCEPDGTSDASMLIVGAGDGGLADFSRVLTGYNYPNAILQELCQWVPIDQVNKCNTQMWKAFQGDKANDHEWLSKTQLFMNEIVDSVWREPGLRDRVQNHLLRPLSRRPAVQLACNCCHFGMSYVANRIVAQILARALAQDLGANNRELVPFLCLQTCSEIVGVGHECSGNAFECSGEGHRVSFVGASCDGARDLSHDPCLTGRVRANLTPKDDLSRGTVDLSVKPREYGHILLRLGADQQIPENVKTAILDAMQGELEFRDVLHFQYKP